MKMGKTKFISKEDFKKLEEAIENPPPANEKLKEMVQKYNELIRSGKLIIK